MFQDDSAEYYHQEQEQDQDVRFPESLSCKGFFQSLESKQPANNALEP